MTKQGWVAIHRQIQDHWLWTDKPFCKAAAWVDLLLLANHKNNKFLLGNELVEVKQGCLITSEVKLMERWGWSKRKTRAFLDLLQKDGMIVKISDRKRTTINIVNYSDYAVLRTTNGPQTDHNRTTNGPQTDTNNNVNNDNNVNNVEKERDRAGELQEIVDLFNSLCPSLPQLKVLSDSIKNDLAASIANYELDKFKLLFKKAEASSFLTGDNSRKWKATFDWLIKADNIAKVLNGNFDDEPNYIKSYSLELFEQMLNSKDEDQSKEPSEEPNEQPITISNDEALRARAEALQTQFTGG